MDTILVILGGLALVVLGFVATRKEQSTKIRLLVMAGGVCVIYGSWLSERDAELQTSRLIDLNTMNLSLAERNAALTEGIAQMSERNVQLSEDIRGNATGGNAFCYLTPLQFGSGSVRLLLQLGEGERYPIPDLRVRVLDRNRQNAMRIELFRKIKVDRRNNPGLPRGFNLLDEGNEAYRDIWKAIDERCFEEVYSGTLPIRGRPQIFDLELESPIQRYHIEFNARNGSWWQELVFVRRDEDSDGYFPWIVASQVSLGAGRVIEDVPDGFPLTEEGVVEWDGRPDKPRVTDSDSPYVVP
ncbi:MAG: hypothetical protein R3F07_03910 [Opitutaceae bacterium]